VKKRHFRRREGICLEDCAVPEGAIRAWTFQARRQDADLIAPAYCDDVVAGPAQAVEGGWPEGKNDAGSHDVEQGR
jgi:hypothetical protein